MPDFVMIGAMKAATSTVAAYLEDHPSIYMVPRCEPNYFSHDDNYARGLSWYEPHFAPGAHKALCGEGSNYYSARSLYPHTATRMFRYNPHLKLLYMVRHPVDRIVSAWIQNRVDLGDEVPSTLDKAVRAMPDRFIGQSRYWFNLEPYRSLFGDKRIFIGFMEDLQRDRDTFFATLSTFLGVAPHEPRRPHLNRSVGKAVPTAAYTRINRLPYIDTAKAVLPRSLRSAVKHRVLSHRLDSRPRFSERTHEELVAILEPEARRLLVHCGKPEDFWVF